MDVLIRLQFQDRQPAIAGAAKHIDHGAV